MKKASATLTIISAHRGVVDIDYGYGKDAKTAFSTVEFNHGKSCYDQGYDRAEVMAQEHGCRLERFQMATELKQPLRYRVYDINAEDYSEAPFESFHEAVSHAKDNRIQAVIYLRDKGIANFCPVSGVKYN